MVELLPSNWSRSWYLLPPCPHFLLGRAPNLCASPVLHLVLSRLQHRPRPKLHPQPPTLQPPPPTSPLRSWLLSCQTLISPVRRTKTTPTRGRCSVEEGRGLGREAASRWNDLTYFFVFVCLSVCLAGTSGSQPERADWAPGVGPVVPEP